MEDKYGTDVWHLNCNEDNYYYAIQKVTWSDEKEKMDLYPFPYKEIEKNLLNMEWGIAYISAFTGLIESFQWFTDIKRRDEEFELLIKKYNWEKFNF